MRKQSIVIGLGLFGMSVARALADRGVEVLAVDKDEERVRVAAGFADESACFDATDADALEQIAPQRRDICLCAIGDESSEASIITTALLRQMGAPRVVARANTDVHARILTLVGAHRVVNPEREYGTRFANQILGIGIRDEMSLGEGVLVTEVDAPPAFMEKTLAELALPRNFGVTVAALRKGEQNRVILPKAESRIEPGDVLIVLGQEGAVLSMIQKNQKED